MQILRRGDGARGVIRDQRGNFNRDPAIGAVRPLVNRLEKIRRARNIFKREIEEYLFCRAALA